MGISHSKGEKCEALRLCKHRKKFIKQAIDSRYDFAAAHLAYVQSLREIGIALRRFAESELLLDSPSPPHTTGAGTDTGTGDQPPVSTVSYMRSGATNAVTVSLNPSVIDISSRVYVDDIDTTPFTMPPPPPPPESASSWDYFDPADETESFRFVGHDGFHVNFNNMSVQKQFIVKDTEQVNHDDVNSNTEQVNHDENESGAGALVCRVSQTESNKDSCCLTEGLTEAEEDPTEFITHRAKDFLSSIKEIEGRFFSACESGKEVSRMLEVDKVRIGCPESKGSSTASNLLCGNCRKGKTALISHDVTNIITWKRSTSLHSSSSRNPLAPTSKDANNNNDDSGSDFFEEFCMIAGNHSSTLDRLYAWERKLYDEVKASESIRKVYDRKCDQLRHQFAKDLKSHVIDKTRAIVKDLHSRIIVALHTVDSISKRIEKMRDEELQPQILELIQGLNRMWKAMLECHHAQYITISLAYHLKKSKSQQEPHKPIIDELQHKIEHFGLSFIEMVNSQTAYVESVNSWLQNCIIQPKERSKKRAFSPRRSVGPPILVICRDWSAGIQGLPAQQVSDSIEAFLSHLNEHSVNEVKAGLTEEEEEDDGLKLRSMHSSLTKVLDALTKYSECSLKMYEDIKMKGESAQKAYSNYSHRPPPRAFSI